MSDNWSADIENMHNFYGMRDRFQSFTPEEKRKFLEFRIKFLEEELNELKENSGFFVTDQNVPVEYNPEEIVDALIDLCVVAIGTLDAFEVNANLAWDKVLDANMSKKVGIKASRPNPLGLPDLIKPEGWQGPDHAHNHGSLWNIGDK
jgi:predicted HAD superfamily Cof-like phosphohydrolase